MTTENATDAVEQAMLKTIKAGFGLPASVLNGPSNYSSSRVNNEMFEAGILRIATITHTPAPTTKSPPATALPRDNP